MRSGGPVFPTPSSTGVSQPQSDASDLSDLSDPSDALSYPGHIAPKIPAVTSE